MPLKSDLALDYTKLEPSSISPQTNALNDSLIEIGKSTQPWWEIGAPEYRRRRWAGETSLPRPTVIERGQKITLPSREEGREIPCRVMMPDPEPKQGELRGVFYHIHGGGWCLQSEEYQDPLLSQMANAANLAVVSVGYRLAPEHPFPAGPEDCHDIAEWLVDHAQERFGVPMRFMGGESAGGHLTALTVLHLLQARPSFSLTGGLLFSYGCFDLSFLPTARNYPRPIILTPRTLQAYMDAFLPGLSPEQRRDPSISPFYADLSHAALGQPAKGQGSGRSRLPAALFLCGTEDCLLDDTLMMSVKWLAAGAEAMVKISTGAPHGFTMFDAEKFGVAKEGDVWVTEWLRDRVGLGA